MKNAKNDPVEFVRTWYGKVVCRHDRTAVMKYLARTFNGGALARPGS